jgi:hypothetical protein
MTNQKCPSCSLVNFATDEMCRRCGAELSHVFSEDAGDAPRAGRLLKRALITLGVALCAVIAFHVSLLLTSEAITTEQRQLVRRTIGVLEERGFEDKAWLLRHVAKYRQNDNWLNASAGHADAYAATNFPFEIVTLYPDFFTAPVDDTERAAILLHEAQHLRGADEHEAYEAVWNKRAQLGWTEETYSGTRVWNRTMQLAREYAPEVFNSASSATLKPTD